MGSIPGPIIKFRFDPANVQQVGRQMTSSLQNQFKAAGKQSAAAFVDPLIAKAAKLRAQIAAGLKPEQEVINIRKRLISSLETEIQLRTRKLKYSQDDLAILKKYTQELERQKSFVSGGGGLTAPSSSALRTIVQQAISGISAKAGSYGGGFGSFAGLRLTEPLGKFAEEAEPAHLALLGIGTAAIAAAAALTKMAISGAKFAVEMENLAQKAGISVKSIYELRGVSQALDLDFDTVTRGFKKFSTEITFAMGASLPHASEQAVRASKIFEALGVNVQKAAADPMSALRQLTETLGKMPDGAVKTAVAVQLFGRAGQELLPVMNHFAEVLNATKTTSDAAAEANSNAAKSGLALAIATTNLGTQWKTFEMHLASVFVPLLGSMLETLNNFPSFVRLAKAAPGSTALAFLGQLTNNPALIARGLMGMTTQNAGDFQFSSGVMGGPPQSRQLSPLEKLIGPLLSMDSTGGGGRKTDFSEPLYLGTALEKEWKKYQEAITKSNEALKKHLDLMAKLNAATFAQNSFMTMMLGPIGIAADSPDKTGAGIQKLFDAINEKNEETAKKAAKAWQKQFDKLKESVGNLFDAMLQGSKSFGEALKRMVETALLAPIKEAFSTKIAQLIQSLEKNIQAKTGKNSKGVGGIFAKIMASLGLGGPKPIAQENIANSNVDKMIVGSFTVLGGSTAATAAQLPRPPGGGFMDFLGGGGGSISSLSSLAGIGGLSLALAGAGGTAVAGSGGSAMGVNGGTAVTGGGVAGTAAQASGALAKISGNKAVQAIAPLIPGAALLGVGIATRNGPAMAMGIGSLAGAGLTQLSQLKSLQGTQLGGVLGTLGAAAPGIGMMFAGNQTGGLGGAAMGALGGLQAGMAIGGPIGGVIGAIAGGIMGILGKKNNQQAWNNGVTKAMNNQRITQPLSENFAFAAGNSMASTFGTTFSQGPGGFSNSTLPANTPFWANAILGTPHGTSATIAWNALMNGINPNSPFFGGTNTSPFNGGPLVNGLRLPGAPTGAFSPNAGALAGPAAPSVAVHFTVPGYVDKNGLNDIVSNAAPLIHQTVTKAVYQQSSGMRRAMSRAINLP